MVTRVGGKSDGLLAAGMACTPVIVVVIEKCSQLKWSVRDGPLVGDVNTSLHQDGMNSGYSIDGCATDVPTVRTGRGCIFFPVINREAGAIICREAPPHGGFIPSKFVGLTEDFDESGECCGYVPLQGGATSPSIGVESSDGGGGGHGGAGVEVGGAGCTGNETGVSTELLLLGVA